MNLSTFFFQIRQIAFGTIACVFMWIPALQLSSLYPLPIRNLTDEKFFIHLEVSKDSYFTQIPLSSVLEIHKTRESRNYIRALVPREFLPSLDDKGVEYTILPFPKRLIDIDPSLSIRKKNGCVTLKSMLNGYKDPELNELYLNCIEKEYSRSVKLFRIGNSVESRLLTAARIRIPSKNSPSSRTNVFFHCGIHGNEMIAIEHCYDILIESLTNTELYPFLENLDIWVLPVANPDGLYRHWHIDTALGRGNARGIDLNRNFPFKWNSGIPRASSGIPSHYQFRGYSPGSEPEIHAMLHLFEKERFSFAMGIHCYANAILIPYSIPDTKNPYPNIAEEIGERLLINIRSQREDKTFTTKKNLYPVDGTDQDTFFHRFGTLAYLLETSHLIERYVYVPTILEDIRPSWVNLLKEASSAYQWKLKVVNEENEPLPASIKSNRYEYFEGEIRRASEAGIYQELSPDKRQIIVKVSYPGYTTKILKIYPSRNPDRYEVVLTRNVR